MEGWRYYVAALLLLLPTLLATALVKRCGRETSPCREGKEVGAINKYGKGSCVKHASGEKVRYRPENMLEKMTIRFMAVRLAQMTGQEEPSGFITFDDFAESTKTLLARGDPSAQSELVLEALKSVVPRPVGAMVRYFFPPTQWACETNAAWAPKLTGWLVGASSQVEGEVELSKDQTASGEAETVLWKSSVQIERCRYLEAVGCKTACVNLCKVPTQRFFQETFGLPLTMTPDFETVSCTMTFGQRAPDRLEDDPVAQELCYDVCANVPEAIEDIRLRLRPPAVAASSSSSEGAVSGGVRHRRTSSTVRTCHTAVKPPRGSARTITLSYSDK